MSAMLEAGKDPSHPLYKAAARIQAQFRGHLVSWAQRRLGKRGSWSAPVTAPCASAGSGLVPADTARSFVYKRS